MNTIPARIFDEEPPRAARPDPAQLRALAEKASFPSREASPAPQATANAAPWRYRTGRTAQFNVKASQATINLCGALARRLDRPKAEIIERALAALERELDAPARAGET